MHFYDAFIVAVSHDCWAASKFNEFCTHAFNSPLHRFPGAST